jgi:SAM-dependent methyltransferase
LEQVRTNSQRDYWNSYYRSSNVPALASQFAVFMLGEFTPAAVVDIGCGNGRDSLFFADRGLPTIGFDRSQAAVNLCQERADTQGWRHATFRSFDVGDASLGETAITLLRERGIQGPVMLYARFFVHAITDEEESALLRHCRIILDAFDGIFGAEFRTSRDRAQEKVTADHFRRFVAPSAFVANAARFGLAPVYAVEGFGMAKYKTDDAHVARVLLAPAH